MKNWNCFFMNENLKQPVKQTNNEQTVQKIMHKSENKRRIFVARIFTYGGNKKTKNKQKTEKKQIIQQQTNKQNTK